MTKKVGKKSSDKKAETRRRKIDYKTWVFVGLAVIALAFVVGLIISFSQTEKIDSSYFHDTEGRIVLTMDRDTAALDDGVYEPYVTHIVYYYEGDRIVSVRAFYEYSTEKEARTAYSHLGLGDFADSKNLNGRFVIFQVKRANYEGTSVETLRSDIEAMKEIDALVLDYEDDYINKYGELNFES